MNNTDIYKKSFAPQRQDYVPKYKINNEIQAEVVLVIDEEGENLGEMPFADALSLAEERGLDLIEVSNNNDKVITKIESLSKLKYKESKKRKDSKGKSAELKEMWFKVFISEGDLNHKIKKIEEFLKKKHPVKLTIKAKGRTAESSLRELMTRIIEKLEPVAEKQGEAKLQGRNLGLIVKPK